MWNWLKSGYFWVIGILSALITIGASVGDWAYEQITFVSETIGALILGEKGQSGAVLGQILELTNAVFPLQEAFVMLTAYSGILLTAMTYRFFKSWIPTVS
jgi:hypothetical protein